MDKQVDKILEYVRHAKGNERLMELSFGCVVEDRDRVSLQRVIYGENPLGEVQFDGGVWLDEKAIGSYARPKEQTDKYKIIGHPVQWANVLVAAHHANSSMNISQLGELFRIENGERNYLTVINLTKLPAEELQTNTELREFLLDLFNLNDHGSN